MENYIVRIHRRGEQHQDDVIGMVERVERDDKRPFRNLSELCEILLLCPADACKPEMHMSHEQSAHVTPITKYFRHR